MRVILGVLLLFMISSSVVNAQTKDVEQVLSGRAADSLSNAYYSQGLSYFWEGQYSRALEELNTAIDLAPKDARYWYFKTIAEKKIGTSEDVYSRSAFIANKLARNGFPARSKVGTALERIQGNERIWLISQHSPSARPSAVKPTSSETVSDFSLVSTIDQDEAAKGEQAQANVSVETYQEPEVIENVVGQTEHEVIPSSPLAPTLPSSDCCEEFAAPAVVQVHQTTQFTRRDRALFARERAALRIVLGSRNTYKQELYRIRSNGRLLNRRRQPVYTQVVQPAQLHDPIHSCCPSVSCDSVPATIATVSCPELNAQYGSDDDQQVQTEFDLGDQPVISLKAPSLDR